MYILYNCEPLREGQAYILPMSAGVRKGEGGHSSNETLDAGHISTPLDA